MNISEAKDWIEHMLRTNRQYMDRMQIEALQVAIDALDGKIFIERYVKEYNENESNGTREE